MRLALLITITTAAGLGACAPLPVSPYGYGYAPAPAQASYGYYNGAYAPGPYYAEPGYAPYAVPGAIIVGGERRFEGGERYRDERPRNEGGYRGNPNPQRERDFRPQQGAQNFGGGRPGPAAGPMSRPAPPAAPQQQRPQGGPGPAAEFNPASPGAHGGGDR